MRHVVPVVWTLMTFGGCAYGQATPNATTPDFGGKYVSLKAEQKAIVDDWFRRLSATIQKPVDPEKAYDNLPLSTKTTFNAVTHVLLSTQLTDESGRNLGLAFQIIDKRAMEK